jgi:purine-binding chemotaxis protein CheW
MGRMADARKRARQAAAQAGSAPGDAAAAQPLPAEVLPLEPMAAAAATPPDDSADAETPSPVLATLTPDAPAASPDSDAAGSEPLSQAMGELDDAPGAPPPASESNEPGATHDAPPPESVPSDAGEELVFPGDEPELPRPLRLPSSGLAADILSQVEGAQDAPSETSSTSDPEPADDEPTTASQEPASDARAAATRAHHFSFFAAPEKTKEIVEATEHLVTFLLGSEEYGVDVRAVQEIIRVPAITAVPRAPVFIRGVINLRGRIIPVVDLKEKLGLGPTDDGLRRARVLVVRLRGRLIGLLVDGASQVLKVPVSAVEAAPDEVLEVDATFIRGVAKLDKRLIILIDLLEVLAPELRAAGAMP